MLDIAHLGDEVGRLYDARMGVPPCEDQLDACRFLCDEVQDVHDVDKAQVDRNVQLVEDNEVVAACAQCLGCLARPLRPPLCPPSDGPRRMRPQPNRR